MPQRSSEARYSAFLADARAEMQSHIKPFTRCCCLTLLLSITPAGAQNPPPEPAAHIRSEVREVVVPVVVTNTRGRHVTGLKASDFQVFEDGKLEHIVAFRTDLMPSAGSTAPGVVDAGHAPAAPVAAAATADDPRQTYLILVDTLHSSFANVNRVRGALEKFFEEERSAESQYALIALGRSATVIQDSTRDASTILAALRSNGFSKSAADSDSAGLASAADQFAALMRAYCTYCYCTSAGNMVVGEQPQCPDAKARVQAFLIGYSERSYVANQQFLKELRKIVEAIASMPTSRTIVFLSDGFNRFPGRELYAILLGYGPKDRSFELNPRSIQPELDAILKFATAKDVRFYTIDSRGLYTSGAAPGSGFDASSSSHIQTQMDARGSPNIAAGVPEAVTSNATSAARESADPLAQLARETGGLFFENSNDLMKGVRQAVEDGREYYVLSYVPGNNTWDGKYRRIQVTVKDGKWQVHAKAGYWASEN